MKNKFFVSYKNTERCLVLSCHCIYASLLGLFILLVNNAVRELYN